MDHKKDKYLIIGDLCLDIFMQIDDFPRKGGDGNVRRISQHLGGSAANTAIALAKLGGKPTLLTHIGSDSRGKQVLSILKDSGVSTNRIVQEIGKATGLTISIVTNDAERTLLTHRGANGNLSMDEISTSLFSNVEFLHISSYALIEPQQSEVVIEAVKLASNSGCRISLDVATVLPGSALKQLLPYLYMIVLGKSEAISITQEKKITDAISYLLDVGVKIIGLKKGKQGSRLISLDHDISMESFPIEAVDTTGAGDSFCAGLIYGFTHHWTLGMAGRLANAMGALVASRWGAGEEMPSVNEIIEFLTLQNKSRNDPIIDQILNEFIG